MFLLISISNNHLNCLIPGKQRYFGTLGYLLVALAVALFNQFTSSGSGQTNLTANFITYAVFIILCAISAYFLQINVAVSTESFFKNAKTLIGKNLGGVWLAYIRTSGQVFIPQFYIC